MGTLKRNTTVGLFWNLIDRLVSKCIRFVFSLWIARCLMPEAYGTIAIANVVIMLSDILVDSGFSKALINKQNRTDDDYNTVFWFSVVTSIVLYVIIFSISPTIERFYAIDSLSTVIRVQSIILIINSFCGVQYLHVVADMNFRIKALIELICALISGAVGLYLAFNGAGVWALVIQSLTSSIIGLLFMWISVHWVPELRFSFKIVREYFTFGVKILISDYIGRMYSSLFSLVIGKRFSSASLGLYGKASSFADMSFTFISGPVMQVTYPAISRIQGDRESMKRNFYEMFSLLSYVAFPVMFGLLAVAEPLVTVILSESWNGMIPLLRVLSISAFIGTMSSIPSNYLYVMGYSGISLRIRVLSCVIGLVLFFLFCRISLLWVCIGISIVGVFVLLLQFYYLKKYLGISCVRCLRSVFPSVILSVVMFLLVYFIIGIIHNMILQLVSGILVGIVIFIGVSALLNFSCYTRIKELTLSVINR